MRTDPWTMGMVSHFIGVGCTRVELREIEEENMRIYREMHFWVFFVSILDCDDFGLFSNVQWNGM